MNHLLHLAGTAAIWVALVSALTFCVTYAAVAPWRSTGEGWHLMTFTGVVGLAFGWLAYRSVETSGQILPTSTEAPRAAMYTAMAGLLVWRLALLIRNQIRRRRKGRMTTPEPENTPPEAGQYLEADLQGGITQDPADTRAEEGKL